MAPAFRYPDKPRRGDAVAVLSPSAGLPARFPLPYELGLTRLREEFGLRPVEYPSTRAAQASPAQRAADIHAAFADPAIKAIIASIGGEDELKVLAHLDPDVLRARPKPFFGYSDNTNLHLFLWNLGQVSYLGGSVMVQFGRPVAMHPVSRQSLERFAAIVWGRPKAWALGQPNDPAAKTRYTKEQHEAVLAAVTEYHPGAPLVFGADFGHTEPQLVIPSGGTVTVDGRNQQIEVTY